MCGMRQRRCNWQLLPVLLLWLLLLCLWQQPVKVDALPSRYTGCLLDNADAMDVSKSPCDNFHEYACGNWHAPYGLRVLGAHDMRSELRAMNKQLLVRHFEQAARGELVRTEERQEEQLLTFYGSCMSGRQSLHVYMEEMQRLVPHWPLLDNGTRFDWASGSAALRRYGAQGVWRLLVQPNWQAAEQRVFYVLAPSFELLGKDEQSEFLYQRYLKYLLLELGMRVRRAASLAAAMVEFELELRNLLTPPSPQSDSVQTLVLHAPQTLQQLAAQLPQLQLIEYFQQLLGERYTPQLLVVADMEYLRRLQRVMRNADTYVLSSWLLLQLPAHFELHLHEDMSLATQREHCLQQLNHLLPQELSQLQLRLLHGSDAAATAFLARTHTDLQLMFDSLKQQFERLFNATPIFEENAATQALALQKLRAMRLLLPPQQLQPEPHLGKLEKLEKQEKQSNLTGYDAHLLRLSLAQAEAEFRLALECLQLPCTAEHTGNAVWQAHSLGPLDVNVYYRLKLNAIELPLGLLRAPLLATSCGQSADTAARMLGGLGYMLGHEMLHAFDYDGINYDAAGRAAGGQWPAKAIIRFGLRAGCYLGARYTNATLTINENIADSEGLRLAYEAYLQQHNHHQQQQQQQQQQQLQHQTAVDKAAMRRFFVAFAQNWCGQAAAPSSVGHQQHASHWERVNNVLGNFPEFADAFQCEPDTLMHPERKCRIW